MVMIADVLLIPASKSVVNYIWFVVAAAGQSDSVLLLHGAIKARKTCEQSVLDDSTLYILVPFY